MAGCGGPTAPAAAAPRGAAAPAAVAAEASDLDRPVAELLAARCEHGIPTYTCDECRYEVGVAKAEARLFDPAQGGVMRAAVVAAGPARAYRELPGEVVLDANRSVTVTSPAAGIVTAVGVDLGDRVRRGDPLVRLECPAYREAAARLAEAAAAEEAAAATLAREEKLFARRICPEKDVIAARAEHARTRAGVRSAEAVLRSLGVPAGEIATLPSAEDAGLLVVRAPLDGVVVDRRAAAGARVEPGAPLVAVADTGTVWVLAELHETDVAVVTAAGDGAAAQVEVAAWPGRLFPGRVRVVSGTLDPLTRTARARVVVDNAEGQLRAGMFARVRLAVATEGTAINVRAGGRLGGRGAGLRLRSPPGRLLHPAPGPRRGGLRRPRDRDRGARPRRRGRHRRRLPPQVGRAALEDGRGVRGLMAGRMERFFAALLAHRLAAMAVGLALAAAGVAAWRALPIDAFPDVTNVQVMILARADGYSTTDVERRVTYPIEQRMGGLPDVALVRSLSRAGLSQVVVIFHDGVDPYFARQVVFERLSEVRGAMPPGVEPEMAPLSTGLGEIFQYTLEGDGYSPMEKRTLQEWLVAPRLRTVPGVTEVNSFGGQVAQVQVVVSPDRLKAHGLTLRDVEDALSRGNTVAGAGYVLHGWEQTVIRGDGLYHGAADVADVVLRSDGGTPVLVRDVASVAVGGDPIRQGAVTRDGRGETVAGMVIMLRGENARTVVANVEKAVADLAVSLPKGLHLDVFYDRTSLVQACLDTVSHALLEGGILVVIVLALFLAEIRTSVVVVLSLPFTFLITFVAMRATGLTANLMTVGGLAFSVGMVVDGAIVVAENIRRHLAEDADPDRRRVIAAATAEVARPVAFSILIIAIVLVPLLTLQGLEGKMFVPLATTLLLTLLASIVVAVLFVPPLAALVLRRIPERELPPVRALLRGYAALLAAARRRPGVTVGVAVAVLAAAAALAPSLGTSFLPDLDEGAIAVNVVRLPTASLDGSVQVAQLLERRILAYPEVATVVSKTGRPEIAEDPMGPEQSDMIIMLKDRRTWTTGRTKAELVAALEKEITSVPGLRPAFSQPIALRVNELVSGVKGDLAVKVFGPDLEVLKSFADQTAAVIQAVPGAADVKVEQVSGMAEVTVVLDRPAMARFGLSAADVTDAMTTAFAGRVVTELVDGERRVPVAVRFPESARRDVATLGRLLVPTPAGTTVPLARVARLELTEEPMVVGRENGMRRVTVEANVRGRDLGGFVAEVQRGLTGLRRELPSGYWVEYGGQFEQQQRAMRQLAVVVPVALLLVLVLLYSALGSARDAVLVLVNLPFALVGGVVAAVVFGMPLSVSAAVAFIVLLGIAVQNGVVLVAFFRQLRARGVAFEDAVSEGCRLRFKPLIMTALTSFIGHAPMVWAMGSGADIQKPLAVIVMGGIVTSTLLTLVVLPVLYDRFGDRQAAVAGAATAVAQGA